ncbi:MAG: hypothetical protein WC069_01630 [Candidatus Shapirobacteria bacterium]
MIYIFHGDDQYKSQQAYQTKILEYHEFEVLHVDNKSIDFDKLNQYVNSQSLFGSDKVLVLDNPFSLIKASLDKLVKAIQNNDIDIIIWQERTLKPTENNIFGKAFIQKFPLDKKLFATLNALRPGNIHSFCQLYQETLSQEPFELFFFWLKNTIRKNLTSYSKFPQDKLKEAYLKLIEMEYLYKNGKLHEPKESSCLNILVDLMS